MSQLSCSNTAVQCSCHLSVSLPNLSSWETAAWARNRQRTNKMTVKKNWMKTAKHTNTNAYTLTLGIWKSARNWALWSDWLWGEIRENGDTTLSDKQRHNHGNPGYILTWRSDEKVDIPHTCPPVFPDQKRGRKEQSKQSHHKASSRAVVCIFHVKWKATKMPSRMWGIFLFSVIQARTFWLKGRQKKLVSKAEKRVEMRNERG